MKTHLALASCLLAASLASAATGAVAAETVSANTWPERPVKVIVGFAPGGPTDLVARLIAQQLAAQTGKNFFVENISGAGGNVGTVKAAQSAPDGYTILVTGGNITNNPFLFAHAGFDTLKDFDAVTLAAATPVVLAVHPSVPAKTVKELVEWIKANPGKESYASPGTGTPPQLTGALFVHALNLDLVHVPFGGGGPAVEATVGNHTPISFGAMAPAVPLIKNGDLRALAVTGKTRIADPAGHSDHGGGRLPRSRGRHLDRRRGAGRHAEGHRRQAARHDRQKPRRARRQRQARRHGLCGHRQYAGRMHGVLQGRNGQVGQGDQGRGAEGGMSSFSPACGGEASEAMPEGVSLCDLGKPYCRRPPP